jgi:hypothetical protein
MYKLTPIFCVTTSLSYNLLISSLTSCSVTEPIAVATFLINSSSFKYSLKIGLYISAISLLFKVQLAFNAIVV